MQVIELSAEYVTTKINASDNDICMLFMEGNRSLKKIFRC